MSEMCFWTCLKPSDRVWHDGLIHKTKCIEINGMLLELIAFWKIDFKE